MTIKIILYLSVFYLPLLPWKATASSKSYARVQLLQLDLHFPCFFVLLLCYTRIFGCLYLPLRAVQADGFVPHQIAVLIQGEELVGDKTLRASFEARRTRRLGGMGPRSPSRLLKASRPRKHGLKPAKKLASSRQEVLRPHIVKVPVKTLTLQVLSQGKSL